MTISCNRGYEKVDEDEVVRCVTKSQYDPPNPKGCQGGADSGTRITALPDILWELCGEFYSK